jgi:hypothetical protein
MPKINTAECEYLGHEHKEKNKTYETKVNFNNFGKSRNSAVAHHSLQAHTLHNTPSMHRMWNPRNPNLHTFTSLFDPTKAWEIYTAESGSSLVFNTF